VQRSDARTLTRYNAWANELLFAAVAALPEGEAVKPRRSVFRNMVHTLNHNYVIDRISRRSWRVAATTTPRATPRPSAARRAVAQQSLIGVVVAATRWTMPAEPNRELHLVGGGEGAMTRGEMLQHLVKPRAIPRLRRADDGMTSRRARRRPTSGACAT
jgi:uncharacterized damage-inducible protein DinB